MKQVLTPVACMTLVAGMAFAEPAGPPTVVIVNQAADAIVNYLKLEKPLGKGATREMVLAALRQTVDQYQGTGVSHVFWNVNYQRVAYRSAVWPSYWDDPDPEKNVTDWPRKYYELHKLGIDDVFAIVIPRCRERGVSPWISLRMNDHHYTGDPSRVSPLFFEHPELRTRGGKGLFNYARPEVREHYLKLAAEVLRALRRGRPGIGLDPDGRQLQRRRNRTRPRDPHGFRARRAASRRRRRRSGAAIPCSWRCGCRPSRSSRTAWGSMWWRGRARDWWT